MFFLRSFIPFDCCKNKCFSRKNNRLQATLDKGLERIESQLDVKKIISNAMEFEIIKNVLFNSRDRLLLRLQRYKTIENHTGSDSPFENVTDLDSGSETEKPRNTVFSENKLKKIYKHLKLNSDLASNREKKLVLGMFKWKSYKYFK
jgi:hypothetical protein